MTPLTVARLADLLDEMMDSLGSELHKGLGGERSRIAAAWLISRFARFGTPLDAPPFGPDGMVMPSGGNSKPLGARPAEPSERAILEIVRKARREGWYEDHPGWALP